MLGRLFLLAFFRVFVNGIVPKALINSNKMLFLLAKR